MKNKVLILFILGMFLISFTSAYTWGTQQQDKCINLGTICPLSGCNLTNLTSINYPNTTQSRLNVLATHSGDNWVYSYCNTEAIGIYKVYGYSSNGTDEEKFIGDFEITRTGNPATVAQLVLYLIILGILVLLFLISLNNGISIQFSNIKQSDDEVIKVNWKKYLKIFALCMSYLFLLAIVFIVWNLIYAYSDWYALGNFFHYLYRLLFLFALPSLIGAGIYALAHYLKDNKIKAFIKRTGLPFKEI